jgi:hypothetical protein
MKSFSYILMDLIFFYYTVQFSLSGYMDFQSACSLNNTPSVWPPCQHSFFASNKAVAVSQSIPKSKSSFSSTGSILLYFTYPSFLLLFYLLVSYLTPFLESGWYLNRYGETECFLVDLLFTVSLF